LGVLDQILIAILQERWKWVFFIEKCDFDGLGLKIFAQNPHSPAKICMSWSVIYIS
jgi:hypothetical protein